MAAQQRDDAVRVADDVVPAKAQHVPAGQLQVEVTPAVAAESDGVVMEGAAVGLDDEPMLRPVEVDLVHADVSVDDRQRQTGAPHEGIEAPLQLPVDRRSLVGELGDQLAETRHATAPRRPPDHVTDSPGIEEVEPYRLLQHALELHFGRDRCEVDDRTSHRGARNVVTQSPVLGME